MNFKKYFCSLVVAAGLLFAGAAYAEKTLHYSNGAEPRSLDPHKISIDRETQIARDLFEGLLTFGPDASLIPGVAEKWDISSDGLVYTFHLRDAKWSNGDPIKAGDFVYAFRRLVDPKTASEYAFSVKYLKGAQDLIDGKSTDFNSLGIEAVDDKTLKITLASPTPFILGILADSPTYPLHKATIEKHGKNWTKPENMVTNGSYKLSNWSPNEYVELVKNPNFHGADTVKIDKVRYYPVEDDSAALRRLRAGEVDVVFQAPIDQVDWLKQNMKDELHISPELAIYYYPVNLKVKPLDDVRVRRALAMAIDRKEVVDKITREGDIELFGIVANGTANHTGQQVDFASWTQEQRDKEAKRLLEEAGFGPNNPLKFTLRYNTSVMHEKVAVAVQAMWKQKLGVDVQLMNTEMGVHYDALKNHDFQVARAGWVGDYNDANTFLEILSTTSPELNYSGYSNPKYDELLQKAATTLDMKERAKYLEEAEKVALADMPIIPIFTQGRSMLVSKKIQGWADNIKNIHLVRYLDKTQ